MTTNLKSKNRFDFFKMNDKIGIKECSDDMFEGENKELSDVFKTIN